MHGKYPSGRLGQRLSPRLRALAVAITLAVAQPVLASGETTGGISGVVREGQSAVAGAQVSIRQLDTGLTRSVATDAQGNFRMPQLPIGRYEVTVTTAGGSRTETVDVGVGSHSAVAIELVAPGSIAADTDATTLGTVQVTAARRIIDVYSTDSGLQISKAQLDKLPVARNVTAVALLAPGVVQGDSGFGDLPAFGGASVAENVYYVNGLNVTNLRNGLGGAEVPFEFYEDFQVKTGGYSAEFGRSTGGVFNAVTKSGSNDWKFGGSVFWRPDRLRGQSPDVVNSDGTLVVSNARDVLNEHEYNFEASGPLIQDRLFFYALVNPSYTRETDFSPEFTATRSSTDGLFWGLSIDWLLNDYHTVELTAFSDQRDIERSTRDWDPASGEVSGDPRLGTSARGGRNASLKYTGFLGENLTMSALIGRTESDLTDSSPLDVNPAIYLTDDGSNFVPLGNFANDEFGVADDQRTAMRLDFDWNIGAHTLSFGIDREKLQSFEDTGYSGGVFYEIHNEDPLNPFFWEFRQRIYGDFETNSNAAYLEGTFRLNDVVVTAGVRNERFENKNGLGGTFLEMDQQWAPRLAAAWDIGGDGDDKLYANLGRYYLPVSNILNIRLAGAFYAEETRYALAGLNPDGTPIRGAVLDPTFVQFDGEVADPRTIVNANIRPMYQDEAILGYAFRLGEKWSADVNAVHRDLGRAIEDSTPCLPLDQIALARYGIVDYCANESTPYVLTNPGSAMTVYHDFGQGDGLERFDFSAAELGYPDAKRRYTAVNFTVQRAFVDAWSVNASYTWSRSRGNYEGTVRGDYVLVEGNAGFTTAFDFPSLLEYGDGDLPNDRRHVLKAWGQWQFAPQWLLGFNWTSASGAPISHYGIHPTDENALVYEAATFYRRGLPAPRGSFGRTPWTHNLDLSLSRDFAWGQYDAQVQLEVFNVFNADNATKVYQEGELDPIRDPVTGAIVDRFPPDVNYGLPFNFQSPRAVQLSARIRF